MTFDEIVKNLSSQNIEHGGKFVFIIAKIKNCL